jgi:hypothetical protein
MQHPVLYLAQLTRYLDSVIQEYWLQLFAALIVLCFLALVWAFAQRGKPCDVRIHAVILPLTIGGTELDCPPPLETFPFEPPLEE